MADGLETLAESKKLVEDLLAEFDRLCTEDSPLGEAARAAMERVKAAHKVRLRSLRLPPGWRDRVCRSSVA